MQTGSGKGLAFLTISLMLTACGGGGGGTVATPAPTSISTTTFTTWRTPDLANNTFPLYGEGTQVLGKLDTNDNFSSIGDAEAATVRALFTFESGNLSSLFLTSTTATASTSEGFAVTPSSALAADPDFLNVTSNTSEAFISDPKSQAWDYQSFGVWETGLGTSDRTLHAMSVGAPTAGTAIPPSGTADFSGKVVGSYVNADGVGHTVLSGLTVGVNWNDRSLTFNSVTKMLISSNPLDPGSFSGDPGVFNFAGAATYDPAVNAFSGILTTTGSGSGTGTLSGSTSGKFYGPGAEELGGVFFLKGTQSTDPTKPTEIYSGAYGARDIAAP